MNSIDDSVPNVQCKNCRNTFKSTSILRHLRKDDCKQAYTEKELNDLKSESKDRATKKQKIWKDFNKEHVTTKAAEYHAENRERLSCQKAKRYVDGKEEIELQRRHWSWLHSGKAYYEKKKFALAQYDKFIWRENGKWHKDINRFKNSEVITKDIDMRLDNLKIELDNKMKDLHDIAIREVQAIEKELGIPEDRKFENYLNDQQFQHAIFTHLRQYMDFKRRHIYYYAQDQLKEIADNLKERLDPWIEENLANDNAKRAQVQRMIETEELEQLRINEEYFHEVKANMFEIHRKDVENGRSKEQSWEDYKKLKKPPAYLFISPGRMYPSEIENCRRTGLIC